MRDITFATDGSYTEGAEPDLGNIPLRQFECPECHANTYGYFEPFYKQHGIKRWCSNCGYCEWRTPEHR